MKIVTLMENTAPAGLTAEHGLSLYLETENHKILFDMGATGAFADNAQKLGVDLRAVDMAVLSHGHYDHGGGMARFLQENTTAQIYVNRHAFEPHFNAVGKSIGLDPKLHENPRLTLVDGSLPLGPGISLHTMPLPPEDAAGLTMGADRLPEDFRHEQYLLLAEGKKKLLLSGCSHKGIRTIVRHFQPDVLIGGFHFSKIQDERLLREAAKTLLEQPTVYYTGHCTGQAQFAVMKAVLGERLQAIRTGTCLEL